MAASLMGTEYLELLRAVLAKKSDWHPHHAFIVARDSVGEGNLNRVIVVILLVSDVLDLFVFTELYVVSLGHQRQWLVAAAMVEIGKPDDVSKFDQTRFLIKYT